MSLQRRQARGEAGRARVVITRRLPAELLEPLRRRGLEVDLWPSDDPPPASWLHERVAGCCGLLCLLTDAVDEPLLEAAGPSLRVISQMAVGVDNIDVEACSARNIPVGHTPGVLTEATADLAVALMLATGRRLLEAAADVRAGRWTTWRPFGWVGAELHASTVGIIGLGRIGEAVARRLAGFDVTLLCCSRRPDPAPAARVGAQRVELHELLERADFVSLHVPLSEQTRHLIDEAALRRMQPHAILINTSRGAVVDQQALLRALGDGWIGGAGLDVTTPEPLPADHPLLALPNVVVLPHIGSASLPARRAMARLAVDNLLAGIDGRPLPAPVAHR